MSVKIMDRVWECRGLKIAERVLLLALADFADDDGYCFPSVSKIGRKTELTKAGVLQILKRLQSRHEIEIVVRGHQTPVRKVAGWQPTNRYRVLVGNAVDRGKNRTVVYPVEDGGIRGATQVVYATPKTEGASLNDPSVQDPSVDPSGGSTASSTPSTPTHPTAKDLVATWNGERKPGPKVAELTPQRQQLYDRALAAKPRLADWRTAIAWLNTEAFANARGTGDHGTWRATLDWLAKPGKLVEILDRAAASVAPRTTGTGRTTVIPGKYDHVGQIGDGDV